MSPEDLRPDTAERPAPVITSTPPELLRSAGIVSVAIAVSRVTGLLRESVLSWLFGASGIFDAYVLGFRIPMLTRELFAEGALSSAFVPAFTRSLATQGEDAARELSDITGTLLVIAVGIFCAIGMLAAPVFVNIFAPGFHAIPGKWELAVSLVRIMFPFLLFVSISAQAQGILNANHRFGLPAISSSVFNVCSVILGLGIGHFSNVGAVHGMAFGVLAGGAAQVCFLLPAVWRMGFGWKPRWNLRHEGVRSVLVLMGPALLGNASSQINTLVNTHLAAGLRDASGHVMNGPVSWLSYAARFLQLPMGLFAVAIASATLPRISRSAAMENWPEFRQSLSRSLVMILLLTVPSTAGLMVLGESMIAIVYQHGKFLASDTHQTAIALSCYAIGLAGAASVRLMAPAFYALGDARTPMLVSLSSIVINALTAYTMIRYAGLGHISLALSVAAVSTFTALALLLLMQRRIGGMRWRVLLQSFAKISAASVAAAILIYGVRGISHRLIIGTAADIADLAIGIPIAVLVFYGAAAALRVPELVEVRDTVLQKLRRTRQF